MTGSIRQIREKITPVLKKHGVIKAGLFGSVTRDDFSEKSDIDILVKTKENISLLDFIGIEQELEDTLGKKVDLVEYHLLKPRIKDKILSQEIRII